MIYITGDTHGELDIDKIKLFLKTHSVSYDDYLIIVGDVCCPRFSRELPYCSVFRFWEDVPMNILFIDGNHENFEQLNKLEVKEWHGGKVHFLNEHIIHLMRGQVYNIEGKTFFTFGGATSIDKYNRTPFVDWFPEEDCSYQETADAIENLEKVDYKVDYILTHTIGKVFQIKRFSDRISFEDNALGSVNNFLDYVDEKTTYKKWFFGHFHWDIEFIGDKKECLFNLVKRIDD